MPALDCSNGQSTYSSAWVGLDGYNDNTVEQTGTEHDCNGGVVSYYAWYEMYPKFGYKVPLQINVGDTITSEVKYVGGQFQLTITDITTGKSFSTNQKSAKARRQSAEWIMEAPWSGGVLPLANFGTANYSASGATLNGIQGSINNSSWQFDQINMVNSNNQLKDQTSALSTDGSIFSVHG